MGRLNLLLRRKPKDSQENPQDQHGGSRLTGGSTRILDPRYQTRDRLQSLALSNIGLQVIAIALALVCITFAARDAYNSKQSKFVPYVVKENQHGESSYAGMVEKAEKPDDATIRATLSAWISNAKMVTPDIALQRKAIFAVYGHMKQDDPAATKMSAYLNADPERTPFKRATRESVSAEVQYVIRQTKDTWQVDWLEKRYDRTGAPIGTPTKWRALVEVYTTDPDPDATVSDLLLNPRWIYVRDWNWAIQP